MKIRYKLIIIFIILGIVYAVLLNIGLLENDDDTPDNHETRFADREPRLNSAFWLGQIYIKKEQYDEARELYQWILKTYPDCEERQYVETCLKRMQ